MPLTNSHPSSLVNEPAPMCLNLPRSRDVLRLQDRLTPCNSRENDDIGGGMCDRYLSIISRRRERERERAEGRTDEIGLCYGDVTRDEEEEHL